MVLLIKNNRKFSQGVMSKIKEKLATLPGRMFRTITFDQALNLQITSSLNKITNGKFIFVKHTHLGKKGVMRI